MANIIGNIIKTTQTNIHVINMYYTHCGTKDNNNNATKKNESSNEINAIYPYFIDRGHSYREN